MSQKNKRIIIEGKNKKGEVFRPSDWAQRLSSIGAQFGDDHRLQFSPFVHPDLCDDVVRLIVDPILEQVRPDIFKHIMNFSETNELVVHLDEVA